MRLRFTKMHGLGNDFVMLDGISSPLTITQEHVRKLADRNFGVGCDQLLIVEPPVTPDADFRYRIFNQDGTEVENCGNGARCFAKFVRDRKLTSKRVIKVNTAAGLLTLKVTDNHMVEVDMGVPELSPQAIPFKAEAQQPLYGLALAKRIIKISAVSMGNPHAVYFVDDINNCDFETLGPEIEAHPQFPNRVNAGFLQIVDKNTAKLRVYERGVGETLACGTGACAAVVAGILNQQFGDEVAVTLPGGTLNISWQGPGHNLLMTGPATTVFHGQIHL